MKVQTIRPLARFVRVEEQNVGSVDEQFIRNRQIKFKGIGEYFENLSERMSKIIEEGEKTKKVK